MQPRRVELGQALLRGAGGLLLLVLSVQVNDDDFLVMIEIGAFENHHLLS